MNRFNKSFTLVLLLLSTTMIHQSKAHDDESWLWWGAKLAGKGAVAVGCVYAAPLVLAGVGFTSAGVAAGSIAATVQSGMGGVIAAGSTFATLQSAGAGGIALGTKAILATAGAVAGHKVVEKVDEKVKK